MADLVTLEEAREALGVVQPDDALLPKLISRASAAVERYTGRFFIHTDLIERHSGGSPTLFLRFRPVVRVDRVTDVETGTDVPETEYVVHAGAGLLTLRRGCWGYGVLRWEVAYTAGYAATVADVPPDVKAAVLQLVAAWYHRRDPGVRAERIGDYSRDAELGLPTQVRQLLAPYVEVVI